MRTREKTTLCFVLLTIIIGCLQLLHFSNAFGVQVGSPKCHHTSVPVRLSLKNDREVFSEGTSYQQNANQLVHRRDMIASAIGVPSLLAPIALLSACEANDQRVVNSNIFEIEDPDTYTAVTYIPTKIDSQHIERKTLPLIVVLHGAGNNQNSALYEFTNLGSSTSPPGDHTQLPLALISNNQAPASLTENFVVVAPYVGKGNRGSLYDEPRAKIISFVKWFRKWLEEEHSITVDAKHMSLFGFSEGATLAVELATTRLFNALVLASYGFTGTLPKLALERLNGIPVWVFHSIGDDVYDIECSKRLVDSLITYQGGTDVFDVGDAVKFTKLKPMEKIEGDASNKGREHVRSALIASRSDEVFAWLLRQ